MKHIFIKYAETKLAFVAMLVAFLSARAAYGFLAIAYEVRQRALAE